MSEISFKGERVITYGDLPAIGEKAPHFDLIKTDLSKAKLPEY